MDPTGQPAVAPATSTAGASLAGPPAGGVPAHPAAAGGPGAGLPSVEAILQKRAAGVKLTKAEAARLSWVGRKPRPPAGSPPAAGPALGSAPVAPGVAPAGPGEVLVPPPVDPDLCKRTAESLLESVDAGTLAWLETLAVKAGADKASWQAYRERAELKPGSKRVLVDTSPTWLPTLLRKFGFDVESAPSFLAGIALLQWGLGFGLCAASLKKQAEERAKQPPPQPEPPKA